MIDGAYPGTSWFLWGVGSLFLLGSALPLLFAPLRWGRAFGWRIPEETGFAVYLGRCLGAVAFVLSIAVLRSAPAPAQHLQTLEILLAGATGLLLVHAWGALRRSQPWKEHLEIAMYLFVIVVGGMLYSRLPGAML